MKQKIFFITAVLCACCFLCGTTLAGPDTPTKNGKETKVDKKLALLQTRIDEFAGKMKIADNFISGAGLVQRASLDISGVLNEVQGALAGIISKDQWESRIISKTHDTGFISGCSDFKKKIEALIGTKPPEDMLKNLKNLNRAMDAAIDAVALFEKTVEMSDSKVLERLEQEKDPVMDIPEIRAKDNNEMKESIIVMTRAGWLEKSIEPAQKALFGLDDKISKAARAVQSLSSSWRGESLLTELEIQQSK